eukprot:3810181-Amphidinium_carterae.2
MSWYSTNCPLLGHPGAAASRNPSGTTTSPKRSVALSVCCKPSSSQLNSTKCFVSRCTRDTMHDRADKAVVTWLPFNAQTPRAVCGCRRCSCALAIKTAFYVKGIFADGVKVLDDVL